MKNCSHCCDEHDNRVYIVIGPLSFEGTITYCSNIT